MNAYGNSTYLERPECLRKAGRNGQNDEKRKRRLSHLPDLCSMGTRKKNSPHAGGAPASSGKSGSHSEGDFCKKD